MANTSTSGKAGKGHSGGSTGPVIKSNGGAEFASLSLTEGKLAVTSVAATGGSSGAVLTYSIVGGVDASLFKIDPKTGLLSFISAPDFENAGDFGQNNTYDVIVQVSDGVLTDRQFLAVRVANGNDAPVITSNGGGATASVNVAENTALVTRFTAKDQDAGASLTYSIAGGPDAALFVIDAKTGELKFKAGPDFEAPADFGADNTYDLKVQVSDGSLTDVQALSVKVTNQSEGLTITSLGGGAAASLSMTENATAVTAVTALSGASVTYSIAGGADAAKFVIDAATGELRFNSAPDFEAPGDAGGDNIYDVRVQASDGQSTDTQSIAVTITNQNEAPVISSNGGGASASVSVAENTSAVTTVASADPDAGASATYSISGGADAAQFTIDAASGELRFITAPDFEAPGDAGGDNVYDVRVQVSDGTRTDTQNIAVKVTNTSEGSTDPGGSIVVSNADELMAALGNASGGETIVLKAGDYGRLSLVDQKTFFNEFSSQVTLTSEDPGNPASFSGLNIRGVDNLKFDGVTFDYEALDGAPVWTTPFAIADSNNIAIVNSTFDGDIARGVSEAADGYGAGRGLNVANSSGITIENNTFSDFFSAASFLNTSDLKVAGNEVSQISGDGFQFVNVDNVAITANRIHDFDHSDLTKTHSDMIQFWTTGSTSPSTNIKITDNYLDAGEGVYTQSIFFRNQVVDQGLAGTEMFYQNVEISNNLIVNKHLHGITVGEANGLVIDNNTLLQKVTSEEGGGGVSVPSIVVAKASTLVTITDNVVPYLKGVLVDPQTGWIVNNNVSAQRDDVNAADYVGLLFSDALDTTATTLADYQVLPGTIIDLLGVGSDLGETLTGGQMSGYILSQAANQGEQMIHSFDAVKLYSRLGPVDTAGATVSWDFGDGTTGTGMQVDHIYAEAGTFTAIATVTLATGKTVQIDKTIIVSSANLLEADFDGTAADLSPVVNGVVIGGATLESEAGALARTTGGETGNAIRLNGGAVAYDAGKDFFGNSEYTLMVDFKKDAGETAEGGRLIYFNNNFSVNLGGDTLSVSITTTAGTTKLGGAFVGINDTDWHRMALTFSGETGTAALYLDGQKIAQVDGLEGATQTAATSSDLYLGSPYGGSFGGLVDNLRFVADALTASQIAADDPLAAWSEAGMMAPAPAVEQASFNLM